jgi:hypothetical protein
MKEGLVTVGRMVRVHVVKTLPPLLAMIGEAGLTFFSGAAGVSLLMIPIVYGGILGSAVWMVMRMGQGVIAEAVCLDKEIAPMEAFRVSREQMEGNVGAGVVSFLTISLAMALPQILLGAVGAGKTAQVIARLAGLALMPLYGFLGVAWYEALKEESDVFGQVALVAEE